MKRFFGGIIGLIAVMCGCIQVDLYKELGRTQYLVAGEPLYLGYLKTEGLTEYGDLSPQSQHFTMSPGDAVAWQIAFPIRAKGIEISGTIKYRIVSGWVTESIKLTISGKYIAGEMGKCFARGESFDGVIVLTWGPPKEENIRGAGQEISLAPGRGIPGVSVERTPVPVKKMSPATWGSLKK